MLRGLKVDLQCETVELAPVYRASNEETHATETADKKPRRSGQGSRISLADMGAEPRIYSAAAFQSRVSGWISSTLPAVVDVGERSEGKCTVRTQIRFIDGSYFDGNFPHLISSICESLCP
jgi:hypothetical protein